MACEDDCIHELGDWTRTTAPTCTTTGIGTRACIICGETDPDTTVPVIEHYLNGRNCTVLCFDFNMEEINSGTFTMGTREVTLTAFRMSRFTVTQELYQEIMGINPSSFSSNPAEGEIQSKRPVEKVTWFDAVEFCNKLSEREGLIPVYTITDRTPAAGYPIINATVTAAWANNGYRLPTEAQWEYACRAGTAADWHFGNTESNLVNYAWYSANSGSITHQVGLKLPNANGLYDMHGNVWEWCWDRLGAYPSINETDPTGYASSTSRVIRGGSWFNSAAYTHSVNRFSYIPFDRNHYIGFRLVRP